MPARDRPAIHPRGRAEAARTAALTLVPPLVERRAVAATRRPIHVAVAVGVTASLYAVSLAGVTGLQSSADARLAADRAPAAGAVAQLRDTHDAMESSLDVLADAYTNAANGYRTIADGIAGHETALAALRKQVDAAAVSVDALSVPGLSRPAAAYPRPSGGTSRTAAAASAPSLARLPAVPGSVAPPARRPVVNACTTASGKPC